MKTPTIYKLIKQDILKVGMSMMVAFTQVSPQLVRLRELGIKCNLETHKRYVIDPATGESAIMIEVKRLA